MPYERAEFSIKPPIREAIGKMPEDIKLIEENGAMTELWVIIGEERTKKIESSKHFKEILAESEKHRMIITASTSSLEEEEAKKAKIYINQLEQEIKNCATQKAKNFIHQLNFKLDSPTYQVQFKALATLTLQSELSYGAGTYAKSDYVTDIFEIDDGDNLLNRMMHNYNNGLEAQLNEDLLSAYKSFYLVFPEKHAITSDSQLDLDLRLLRDSASHNVLSSPALVPRAKQLLGEEFVKNKDGKEYAYIDMTTQKHMELFKKYVPIIRKYAKEYIEIYIQ